MRELELTETKSEEHLQRNPNGRLPSIEDPNTGIVLWEVSFPFAIPGGARTKSRKSGAILLYLADQYDAGEALSYTKAPEKYFIQQWIAFQISGMSICGHPWTVLTSREGQGPYFGQATWFARFHPEKVPSAIDRYVTEVERVIGVINEGLSRNGTGWLVGDRITIADLAFMTWAITGEGLLRQLGKVDALDGRYAKYSEWLAKLAARPVVAKALEQIAAGRKAHGLP